MGQTQLEVGDLGPADPQHSVEAAEIDDLIVTLEDEGARQELIQQLLILRQALEPEGEEFAAGRGFVNFVSDRVSHVGDRVSDIGHTIRGLPQILVWADTLIHSRVIMMRWLDLTFDTAIILVIGLLVRYAVARLVIGYRDRLAHLAPRRTRLARLPLLVARFAIDLVPLACFVVAIFAALDVMGITPLARELTVMLSVAVVAFGLVTALARFVLAPRSPRIRLITMRTATAALLFKWVRLISGVIIWGLAFSDFLLIVGATLPAAQGMRSLVGLAAGVLAIILILRFRKPVSRTFRRWSTQSTWLGVLWLRMAYAWHILAILYVALIFGVWVLRVPNGPVFMVRGTILAVVLIVGARLAMVAIERAIDRLERHRQRKAEEEGLDRRDSSLGPALKRTIQAVLAVIVVVLLLEIWGLGILAWFGTDLGRRALGSLAAIVAVVLASIVVWEIVTVLVDRHFRARDDAGNLIERGARERTLLPLLRNFFLIVLLLIVTMIVMSQIGIDIGPLLAGAGVVGLAIGFGAQTLVKDIITGLFILFEDQIRVGDVVETAGHAGLVEGMTVRTLRLRDLSGTVHILPFSQVDSVKNLTKEFSYYLMDIGVAYRENTDEVIEVIKAISKDLRADPDYGSMMLDDIEVLGVDGFADSAVIIKARIKTLPIQQWTVGREFNRRMKLRFDELGIEIPFPHTTLYFGVDKQGQAPAGPIRIEAADARKAPPNPGGNRGRKTEPTTPNVRGDNDTDDSVD
ncbi:MAG: mechanosensitive ion channel domain-containing protein [Pseudomonadota bacterium]